MAATFCSATNQRVQKLIVRRSELDHVDPCLASLTRIGDEHTISPKVAHASPKSISLTETQHPPRRVHLLGRLSRLGCSVTSR